MNDERQFSREGLIAAWIEQCSADEGTPEADRSFWAYEVLTDMVEERPDDAWPLILEIVQTDQSPPVLELTSAGPLEDLLSRHGPDFINRVEAEAKSNSKFAKFLGGVWQHSMSSEIWVRVCAVRDRRGWDGVPE